MLISGSRTFHDLSPEIIQRNSLGPEKHRLSCLHMEPKGNILVSKPLLGSNYSLS
jgi:hypothetical protein